MKNNNKTMRKIIMAAATCLMLASCGQKAVENPFFEEFDTPFGAPDFNKIKVTDYEPAFMKGIQQQENELQAICDNTEEPTFENTVLAMDNSGEILERVSSVFFAMVDADTNDEITAIAEKISPILAEHNDNIYLDEELFGRFEKVHESVESGKIKLATDQNRLLDMYYKNFLRAGAKLDKDKKDELREINKKLTTLTLKYRDNVLKYVNEYELLVDDEAKLAGLPEDVVAAAAQLAKKEGKEGKWIFKLTSASRIPFLQYAENRDLREQLYKAYIGQCNDGGKYDNKQVLKDVISLRLQKAKLLGFDCYSNFVLEENMAKNSENVMKFLDNLWPYALNTAKKERAELQQLMDKEGKGQKLEAWDWWYYAEKLRQEKFNLSEQELQPYFSLENVRKGLFYCANRMYGLHFDKNLELPVYGDDIDVYVVKDFNGSILGLIYTDYMPRAGKSGGAWMSNFREQDENKRPIVYNVASFTQPVGEKPSLLTLDEVETMFHEFGHALHGLLSMNKYKGISGTNVARDFVELPSQFNEHWGTAPEVLRNYAKHYETGEVIPDELIEKIQEQGTFNQGFAMTELLAASYLDMRLHNLTSVENLDIEKFEKDIMNEIGLIPEIAPRYCSTFFTHIMGGYEAGYYSYSWSEQLDADAFSVFMVEGIFDKASSMSFRKNILERGNSDDPMKLYINFRGQEPTVDALLEQRGLK